MNMQEEILLAKMRKKQVKNKNNLGKRNRINEAIWIALRWRGKEEITKTGIEIIEILVSGIKFEGKKINGNRKNLLIVRIKKEG